MPRTFAPIAVLAGLALAAAAPAAHAQHFRGIAAANAQDVIAVGDAGRVWRSVTGGLSWFAQPALGATTLRDVAVRGRAIVVVGDSGKVWRSADAGGSWTLAVLPGAPDLEGLSWPTPDSLFAVGSGGSVFVSDDAGAGWSAQASGVTAALHAVAFDGALGGWACGAAGTLIRTTDGGASWSPVAIGATRDLRGVAAKGSTVWVVGDRALAYVSTTGGAGFTQVNLRLDSGSDVTAVWLQSPDSVIVAGGGGFLRRSTNHGASWSFLRHTMQSPPSDLCFAGGSGWVASHATPLILRTADAGATWSLPTSATQTRSWPLKQSASGSIRGGTFALNAQDLKTLWVVMGATMYRSRDDGETWQSAGTIPGVTKTNGFVISPRDSNLMVAAVGTPDRIVRSTDGGATWTPTLVMDFGEYGIPIEAHPDDPDTLYFGPDGDKLYMSKDFGATWDPLSTFSFVSPCDIVAVPESDSGVIVVGDGITGSGIGKIHRSNDGGVTWKVVFSPTAPPAQGSEIPGIATSRQRTSSIYASAWSSGAFKRSLDQGLTWSTSYGTNQTWGCDVAKDDPDLVVMGTYSFNNGYLSFDGGGSWSVVNPLGGSNYTFYAKDRATILAQQSNGIYKLSVRDSVPLLVGQSLALSTPSGGQILQAGAVFNVTWTSSALPLARIEYRTGPAAAWQEVALVDGWLGSYAWTVPHVATYEAELRISDAWDGAPLAATSGTFTIALPLIEVAPLALDFGDVAAGGAATEAVVVTNTGTGLLQLGAISTGTAHFTEGRDALNLAAGDADTIGVTFRPAGVAGYADTLTLAGNAWNAATVKVPLAGAGILIAPGFAASPSPLVFPTTLIGAVATDTLRIENPGNAPLVVSAVTSTRPTFRPGRASFTIPAGGADTLGVSFEPVAAGWDSTELEFATNDPGGPHVVIARGPGAVTLAAAGPTPEFGLAQNQPNPFAGTTTIRYSLATRAAVTLEVFNLQGQRVATLARGEQGPGVHSVTFGAGSRDASGARLGRVGAGVYFYRLVANGQARTRKMLVMP
jgi:photosystem II stability/assembly factor-like uncharacterized protein